MKPTEKDIENKTNLLANLEKKYDMKKLINFSKEEIIDIVHKAKCGKLKGLDTSKMTRIELINTLIQSKCPEIHGMIVEIQDVKQGLEMFIDKFVEDGKKVTRDNIYYSGFQQAVLEIFLYDAWKNKQYDCILKNHHNPREYSDFTFDFSIQNYRTENIKQLQVIIEQILECIKKGIKIIAIPFGFNTKYGGHANAMIYRVEENTFERFEPHGSAGGLGLANKSNLVKEKAIDDFIQMLKFDLWKKTYDTAKGRVRFVDKIVSKPILRKPYNKWIKSDDENHKKQKEFFKILSDYIDTEPKYANKIIKDLKKYMPNTYHIVQAKFDVENLLVLIGKEAEEENIPYNDLLNEHLKYLFTDLLPSINSSFKDAKYITPDLITLATKGIQGLESKQMAEKNKLTKEEYQERIGGFCVMWSVLYFNLVFKFPDTKPSLINENLLDLLNRKGEFAFTEFALGYLQGFKNYYNKYIGKLEYSKFVKSKYHKSSQELKEALEKFIVF